MKFLKSVLVLLTMFSISICVQAQTPPDGISVFKSNSENLKQSLSAAKKYNSKMKFKQQKPFHIDNPGTEELIDYKKYGEFKDLGTPNYKYVVKDMLGLKDASGTGIYPNKQGVYEETGYSDYVAAKNLKGNQWDYVNSSDFQANFYKWATTNEDPGVKLYYTAYALENAGNYKRAIKAYYACLVFFPKSIGLSKRRVPWYIGTSCIDRIKSLTESHPEFKIKLEGAVLRIENRFDADKNKIKFYINPGKLVPVTKTDLEKKNIDLSKVGIKKVTGKGKVKLVQYNNDNFQLTVDDKPYIVRAVCYSPTKVGLSPDYGTVDVSRDWSFADYNDNGLIDGPYEAWVDANRNEKQDSNEKPVGDFTLMREMGINTLRIYHYFKINKQLLKDGYETYGFMYMVGNLIGMYGVDSGAEWFEGTDYTNPEDKKNMLNSVRKMVEEYKNEPYVLMWVLGNENNYGTVGVEGSFVGSSNKAQKQPEAYYKFVNECAKLIKSLDPQQRPVVICNGDDYLLNYCAKYAPDIDIYGANSYRGKYGFGSLWRDIRDAYLKPVVITEYGCPAYAKDCTTAEIETYQAEYHKGCWNDIENNMAGVEDGAGNALGGGIFEWTDEWWKAGSQYSPLEHCEEPQWKGPFFDGFGYEEWFGICSIGDGKESPFKRQLRAVFFMYQDLWKKYKQK